MQINKVLALGKTGGWVILLTILLSCQSLLISYSKSSGQYTYSTTSTVLLAEIVKIFLAAAILYWSGNEIGFRLNNETLLYAAPALIYFIQNNLVFWALIYVNPTTYQILVNLKILTTGVLFRFVMGKELSSLQWSALVLLMVGCTVSQLETSGGESQFQVPFQGLLICMILAVTSAAAGIVTEWIMKKSSLKQDPLHRQNMHLYFFGIIFNIIGYLTEKKPGDSFFDGYNVTTLLVVLSYSFSGLTVSIIMKYADNMVKIYAVAVSMVLTLLFSIFLFDYQPTLQLFLGITIITISILMYFNVVTPTVSAPPAEEPPTERFKDEEEGGGFDSKKR